MKRLQQASASHAPIVVIEEGAEQLYSIRFMLESLGYKVLVPPPGALLAEWAGEVNAEAVVVDMMLPGDVALRVIREIRAAVQGQLKIVAVTAEVVSWSEDEIRRAGADEILVKPYSVTDLQQNLHH